MALCQLRNLLSSAMPYTLSDSPFAPPNIVYNAQPFWVGNAFDAPTATRLTAGTFSLSWSHYNRELNTWKQTRCILRKHNAKHTLRGVLHTILLYLLWKFQLIQLKKIRWSRVYVITDSCGCLYCECGCARALIKQISQPNLSHHIPPYTTFLHHPRSVALVVSVIFLSAAKMSHKTQRRRRKPPSLT